MENLFNDESRKGLRQRLRKDATWPEIILWSKLKDKQLDGHKFRRQYGVGKFVVDFYCSEARLAIELDGDSHFIDVKTENYDKERQAYIEKQGISFLRFNNDQVYKNVDGVLVVIENFLRSV